MYCERFFRSLSFLVNIVVSRYLVIGETCIKICVNALKFLRSVSEGFCIVYRGIDACMLHFNCTKTVF